MNSFAENFPIQVTTLYTHLLINSQYFFLACLLTQNMSFCVISIKKSNYVQIMCIHISVHCTYGNFPVHFSITCWYREQTMMHMQILHSTDISRMHMAPTCLGFLTYNSWQYREVKLFFNHWLLNANNIDKHKPYEQNVFKGIITNYEKLSSHTKMLLSLRGRPATPHISQQSNEHLMKSMPVCEGVRK